jgi:hypothetical protein
MFALLQLIPFLNKLMSFVDKIYSEVIRKRYKDEGRAEVNAEASSQISSDQMVRKEIATKVDMETEDETNAGLIDPRK